jgi:hypothetical protein
MVPVVLGKVVEHTDAGGRVDGEEVTAASAIFGRAFLELRFVVVDERRPPVIEEFEAAAQVLPVEGLGGKEGGRS